MIGSSAVLLITKLVRISGIYVTESMFSINDSTVNITWSPPLYPNGHITGYNISITNNNRHHWVPSVREESIYSYLITGLSE